MSDLQIFADISRNESRTLVGLLGDDVFLDVRAVVHGRSVVGEDEDW